jgi:acetyl-CoA carboxylase biotin carboxyl carrier protein
MKPKEIQELLDFIASSGLAEVNIETEQFKISVKKHPEVQQRTIEVAPLQQLVTTQPLVPQSQPIIPPTLTQASSEQAKPAVKGEKAKDAESTSNLVTIKSPMIGTFYRSSSPDTPSFANVGDEIQPGKPVCIIEAMKLFNEIESEISGKIVKVLVENATPVEYDQPLFLVEPA